MRDSVAADAVIPLLRGRFGRPYRYVARCPSTQLLVTSADPEGAVAVTDEQTAGRGRLGRVWHAPAGTSVLLSLLLRPDAEPARLPTLTLAAGAAVAAAIEAETGLVAQIEFPNDVLLAGRKVAGILAEARDGVVVLGVGVNVNQTPEDLPENASATSLRIERGRTFDRAQLVAEVLAQLEREYDAWLAEAHRAAHVPGRVDG